MKEYRHKGWTYYTLIILGGIFFFQCVVMLCLTLSILELMGE